MHARGDVFVMRVKVTGTSGAREVSFCENAALQSDREGNRETEEEEENEQVRRRLPTASKVQLKDSTETCQGILVGSISKLTLSIACDYMAIRKVTEAIEEL